MRGKDSKDLQTEVLSVNLDYLNRVYLRITFRLRSFSLLTVLFQANLLGLISSDTYNQSHVIYLQPAMSKVTTIHRRLKV